MSILESIEKRRTYYALNKELPVSEEQVVDTIQKTTELVPDAFNMRSARVIVVLGKSRMIFGMPFTVLLTGKLPGKRSMGFEQLPVLFFILLTTML